MMQSTSKLKDYYRTLGVPPNASTEDIKRSFRKLAMQCHPDRPIEDKQAGEARFKEVNEAYEVLSDSEKRRRFDELLQGFSKVAEILEDLGLQVASPGSAQRHRPFDQVDPPTSPLETLLLNFFFQGWAREENLHEYQGSVNDAIDLFYQGGAPRHGQLYEEYLDDVVEVFQASGAYGLLEKVHSGIRSNRINKWAIIGSSLPLAYLVVTQSPLVGGGIGAAGIALGGLSHFMEKSSLQHTLDLMRDMHRRHAAEIRELTIVYDRFTKG